jgi:multidrug efflux pump subunit AcrA (membrane-fusion protein)
MLKKILIILIIVVAIVAIASFIISYNNNKDNDDIVEQALKEVSLVSIQDLQEKSIPLSLIGEVASKNEVIIKTQAQGEITGIFVKVGEFVEKGRIIAEIENLSMRGAMLQAQGAVDSAEAILAKTQQGVRVEQISILELKLKQADDLLNEEKQSVINTLRSEFATADDVARNKVDQFFSNPESTNPQLSFTATNSQLKTDIEFERFVIGKMLKSWSNELNNLNIEDDLFNSLNNAKQNIMIIRDFLDDTAIVVNQLAVNSNLSQTTIDGWKTAVLTSRTNINTSLSDISSAKNNLNNKIISYDIAKKQYEEGLAGGRQEDVLQAQAGLKQAKGALRQAQSALEKTIIRASISGIINNINIEKGDFVSLFEPVITISNHNALEITAFITEDDKKNINTGAKVIIENKFEGFVSEIAPALDKKTKKIEIKITIVDSKTDFFIEGESVELEVERSFVVDDNTKEIIAPISALKITVDGIFVFNVDENNILKEHKVSIGSVVGDGIIIFSGITSDMEIVLDARGLRDGQEIVIK